MNQFKTVLKFELANYYKNKVFIGITVCFIILQALFLFSPRYLPMFFDGSFLEEETEKVAFSTSLENEGFFEYLEQNLLAYNMELKNANTTKEELEELVKNEVYKKAIFVSGENKIDIIVKNSEMYDFSQQGIYDTVASYFTIQDLTEQGLSLEEIDKLLNKDIVVENNVLGQNQMENFIYTYVLLLLLYMAVLLYSQFITASIVTEKTSRAMELLVTSAKPINFIFGKVIGTCIAGLSQMFSILVSIFICFNLNKEYWIDNMVVTSAFDIPLDIIIYMITFFICGFFIYAFLFAAVASMASKMEDVNSMITPVMLTFIASFFIAMFSASSGSVDTMLVKVCSFIPFTSPMSMFIRISMGEVMPYEIAISIGILVVSTIFIGYLASKIYRLGVLMYGNKPKISTVIKMLRK